MTRLCAHHGDRTITVQAESGATLRAALDATELRVRTGCNGNGSCGLCRVRVQCGTVSEPTDPERLNLGAGLLAAGARLACQTIALGDLTLEVETPARRFIWSAIPPAAMTGRDRYPAALAGPQTAPALRIALDIGTSNLHLTVWNAAGTRRIAGRRGPNPQAEFGSDIITRLQAAQDPAAARRLAGAVRRSVAAALRDCDLDGEPAACAILAVGNTAMLDLLRGSHAGLLAPEAWDGSVPWREEGPLRWERFGQRTASVTLVPPLGGFVGSDLLAAVYAAALLDTDGPALLVDFGTNTEIALWDGATLWVTSAAGGPAFEASGLRCAVPADTGAIFRVRPGPEAWEVLGGGAPLGVCGSGLVDWIACLLGSGQLSRRGTFEPPEPAEARLGGAASGIALRKRDVDLFQRAKAGIGAGIQVLLGRAGLDPGQLRRIVTTGLFGKALDAANAQAVGLLPAAPPDRVEAYDNLALAGCEALLAAPTGPGALDRLRARCRLINLARCAEFEAAFLRNLFLGPMERP